MQQKNTELAKITRKHKGIEFYEGKVSSWENSYKRQKEGLKKDWQTVGEYTDKALTFLPKAIGLYKPKPSVKSNENYGIKSDYEDQKTDFKPFGVGTFTSKMEQLGNIETFLNKTSLTDYDDKIKTLKTEIANPINAQNFLDNNKNIPQQLRANIKDDLKQLSALDPLDVKGKTDLDYKLKQYVTDYQNAQLNTLELDKSTRQKLLTNAQSTTNELMNKNSYFESIKELHKKPEYNALISKLINPNLDKQEKEALVKELEAKQAKLIAKSKNGKNLNSKIATDDELQYVKKLLRYNKGEILKAQIDTELKNVKANLNTKITAATQLEMNKKLYENNPEKLPEIIKERENKLDSDLVRINSEKQQLEDIIKNDLTPLEDSKNLIDADIKNHEDTINKAKKEIELNEKDINTTKAEFNKKEERIKQETSKIKELKLQILEAELKNNQAEIVNLDKQITESGKHIDDSNKEKNNLQAKLTELDENNKLKESEIETSTSNLEAAKNNDDLKKYEEMKTEILEKKQGLLNKLQTHRKEQNELGLLKQKIPAPTVPEPVVPAAAPVPLVAPPVVAPGPLYGNIPGPAPPGSAVPRLSAAAAANFGNRSGPLPLPPVPASAPALPPRNPTSASAPALPPRNPTSASAAANFGNRSDPLPLPPVPAVPAAQEPIYGNIEGLARSQIAQPLYGNIQNKQSESESESEA